MTIVPVRATRRILKPSHCLVKDGRYRDVYIPDGNYQELRELVCERERLQERLGALSNQIVRWLDIYFPEFVTSFDEDAVLNRTVWQASESSVRVAH